VSNFVSAHFSLNPEKGSEEEKLIEVLENPIDWI
jgi:hypothetical protein